MTPTDPLLPREDELQYSAIRAQGAGGQNVNKVSNAVHLRYDIHAGSLPEAVKARLLGLSDQRISGQGVVVIKAQAHRSLERNRDDALQRLLALIHQAARVPRHRRPTRPSLGSKLRRLKVKVQRGLVKAQRGKVGLD